MKYRERSSGSGDLLLKYAARCLDYRLRNLLLLKKPLGIIPSARNAHVRSIGTFVILDLEQFTTDIK